MSNHINLRIIMQSSHLPTEAVPSAANSGDELAAALKRIALLTGANGGNRSDSAGSHDQEAFVPVEPDSFRAAGLNDSEVEALILKFLLDRGAGWNGD